MNSTTGTGGSALDNLLGTFSYQYTPRGNLSSIGERNRTRSFTYDALQRLTQVDDGGSTPVESYTFDAEGNRQTSTTGIGSSSLHITDPANRLTEDEHYIYAFSNAGNMVSKTDKDTGVQLRFGYNDIDQLMSVEEYASSSASSYSWQYLFRYDDRRAVGSGGPDP